MSIAAFTSIVGGILQVVGVIFLLLDLYRDSLRDIGASIISLLSKCRRLVARLRRRFLKEPHLQVVHEKTVSAAVTTAAAQVAGTGYVDNWPALDLDGRLEWIRDRQNSLGDALSSLGSRVDLKLDDLVGAMKKQPEANERVVEVLRDEWRTQEERRIKISKRSSIPLLLGVALSAVLAPILQVTVG